MKLFRLRAYTIYAAAFLLALVVRLVSLGALPLTDREADLALQALAVARGQNPLIGPYPAFLALTSLWMYLFQASNWVARFWPAVAGGLLVLLPALFYKRIGRLASVILAFGLALDPGLLAISRQVNSQILAIFFVLLALGLWINGRTVLAGIAAGMALLGGPAVWPGLIGLAIAVWAAGGENKGRAGAADQIATGPAPERTTTAWRPALIAAAVTIFIAGTLFLWIPSGLSAMADSLPAYLRGWAQPSGVPVGLLLIALALYEFFPIVFSLLEAYRGLSRRDSVDSFLLVWWAVALILAVAYPGRMVFDLAWSVLPMWGLAARRLVQLFHLQKDDRAPAFGQMFLSVILLTYISMTFVTVSNNPGLQSQDYAIKVIGSAIMLAASAALISWGWSRQSALRGLALGATAVLLVYFLTAGWNAAGLSSHPGRELWSSGPQLKDADLLTKTMNNLKQWAPPETGGQNLVVTGVPSPALRWLLRDVERISYVDHIPTNASPAEVITPVQPNLSLDATYRGERFILSDDTLWNELNATDWFLWMAFRTIPAPMISQDQVIFWARLNLFPDGQVQAIPGDNAAPAQQNPQ